MEFDEVVKNRKSVRKYKDESISKDLVLSVIDCARLAPSGCNRQGWRFKVVDDKDKISELKDNNIFTQEFVYSSPCIIFCCYKKDAYPVQKDEGKGSVYGTNHITRAVRDLSIASSFLVLKATDLGLGTCYVGWMNKKLAHEILVLTEDVEILFAITLGYPLEGCKEKRRKSIEEILL